MSDKEETSMEVGIKLSHSKFDMDDAFALRVKAIETSRAAEELWGKASPEARAVLAEIFKRSLEVLHENTERILPNIVTGAPGDMVNINIQVLLAKIEEQVEIIKTANEFERQAAKRQMIEEFKAEIAPTSDEEFLEQVQSYVEHGVNVPNAAVKRLLELAGQ